MYTDWKDLRRQSARKRKRWWQSYELLVQDTEKTKSEPSNLKDHQQDAQRDSKKDRLSNKL